MSTFFFYVLRPLRVCSVGPGMVFHGLARHVFIPRDRGFLLCLGPIPPSIRYTVGFINLTGLQASDMSIFLCMKETLFFLDPVVVADPIGAMFFPDPDSGSAWPLQIPAFPWR